MKVRARESPGDDETTPARIMTHETGNQVSLAVAPGDHLSVSWLTWIALCGLIKLPHVETGAAIR